MSLDFAVLGPRGTPEKTVSLGVDLHHKLVNTAAAQGLAIFENVAGYYDDAEVGVEDLPSLLEQIRVLQAQADAGELQHFLVALTGLIGYAISKSRPLHVIAD